jgi:hypothetical protein
MMVRESRNEGGRRDEMEEWKIVQDKVIEMLSELDY